MTCKTRAAASSLSQATADKLDVRHSRAVAATAAEAAAGERERKSKVRKSFRNKGEKISSWFCATRSNSVATHLRAIVLLCGDFNASVES